MHTTLEFSNVVQKTARPPYPRVWGGLREQAYYAQAHHTTAFCLLSNLQGATRQHWRTSVDEALLWAIVPMSFHDRT